MCTVIVRMALAWVPSGKREVMVHKQVPEGTVAPVALCRFQIAVLIPAPACDILLTTAGAVSRRRCLRGHLSGDHLRVEPTRGTLTQRRFPGVQVSSGLSFRYSIHPLLS